jgi:tetratricopeptide (TPR) repeat protein
MFDREAPWKRDKDARQNALSRPEQETHIAKRPDRVKKYLIKYMKEFLFDELSASRLETKGMSEVLKGVSIPLRQEDRDAVRNKGELRPGVLAENMARVIGIDPHFRHAEAYASFMKTVFGTKAVENLTRKAKDLADLEKYDDACIYFRAALVLEHSHLAAMYGYARVLRVLYGKGQSEEYIGNLKAESLEYFEMLTEFHPNFDSGWYYLGYMYLNLGLYTKAKLAWERYMDRARVMKDRHEIKQRIEQLATPIRIEEGYNAVLSGKWEEGVEILEPFRKGAYKDWWPLWYYLGVAYAQTGRGSEAVPALKEALKGNPRHIESMEELVVLYAAQSDKANVKKYRDKIELVKKDEVGNRREAAEQLSADRARKDRGTPLRLSGADRADRDKPEDGESGKNGAEPPPQAIAKKVGRPRVHRRH